MAKEVVATKVVNTVGWKFDPTGMRDLKKFKAQLTDLKKDMKGLGTDFKPSMAMSGVREVTKKIKKDVEQVKGLHPFAMKDRTKREALTEHSRLMSLQARVRKRIEQEDLRDRAAAAKEKNKILSDLSKKALQKEREYAKEQKRIADQAAREEIKRIREVAKAERSRRATLIRLRSARGSFESTIGRGKLSKDQIDIARGKWKQLTRSWKEGRMESDLFLAKIKGLNKGLRDQSRGVGTLIYKMKKLRHTSLAVTAAIGAFMGSMAVAQTGKEFEQMDLMFKTVFGERAQQDMAFVTQEADRLGINLLKSAKSYAKIAFAAKEMGLSLEDQRNTYTALTEASIVFGQTQDQLMRSMKAVEQMLSKGRVGSEELRQQFGEHMPGAVNIAAKSLNKTTQELNEMMEQGKLASDVFIPRLANALRELAAPHLTEGLRHLAREETRTINAWNEFKKTIFDAGLGKALVYFNQLFTDILKSSTPVAEVLGGMAKTFAKMVGIVDLFISLLASIPWVIRKISSEIANLLPKSLIDFTKEVGDIWSRGAEFKPWTAEEKQTTRPTPQKDTMTNNVRNKLLTQTTSNTLGMMPMKSEKPKTSVIVELGEDVKDYFKLSMQDQESDLIADVAR